MPVSKRPRPQSLVSCMGRDADEPRVLGHATLCVSDVARAMRFYGALGLRAVLHHPHIAIFELRGGTHLLLVEARRPLPRQAVRSVGLVVEDVDAYRARVAAAGVPVRPLRDDVRSGYRGFEIADPDGHVLKVISSRPMLDRLEQAV